VAPGRSGAVGQQSGTKRQKKIFFKFFLVVPLHFFGSKSTISRFGERFRDGRSSLASFVFAVLLLTVPPCSAICKSGRGTCPVPHGVGDTDVMYGAIDL